ncbi:MAG TPA: tRNA 2-thiouridine(34) synthase MnmA [Candidatus Paceibacterota bacterium]
MNVFVGLSGGVDSATSAALLKEAGHEVTGVFIRIYRPEFVECTWKDDRLDAMRVCAALNIPFREIDLSSEYKKSVIDGMIADYAAGITPNPDVLCNRAIKFGAFLTWARKEGADKIATGHYARIEEKVAVPTRFHLVGTSYRLLRGKDSNKDQSYFLFRLTQGDLAHSLFPIGRLTKRKVRDLAANFDLPVAHKHDSQGLCFIGDVSIQDFLSRYISVETGNVLDMNASVIGAHHGAALVTIGQRHGFEITRGDASIPHYAVATNVRTNEVIVSPNKSDACVSEVKLRDVSWVDRAPECRTHLEVQTRYREKPIIATITREQNEYRAHFSEPHIAPPGQSLVMYDGEVCIGGGIIAKTG